MRVETRISASDSESSSFNKWRVGVVAFVFVSAVGVGLGFAALTPSMEIPVDIASAEGMSMSPTFGAGDSGIAFYAPGKLESGDVVIFYEAENTHAFTMHRVVEETDRGFVTQGDALAATDQSMGRSYVTSETRVGEVYVVVDSKGVHLPNLS
jgi:signal peptidase